MRTPPKNSSKIKLIIFDLDGVLVDARELHYNALNTALESIDKKSKVILPKNVAGICSDFIVRFI